MSVIQECFRPEHKAPPLPVLALIGEHDYQAGLADFLLNQLCAGNVLNPIVCLRSSADPLGDQHFLDNAFGGGQDKGAGHPEAGGIMKADWFAKHRSKRAAAALVLINRDELLGDFTSWNAMLQKLQDVQRKVVRRGAGMLVAVLQTYEEGELPADCVASLCKSLNFSAKLVCPLPVCMIGTHELSRSTEAVAALKALGALAHEQCSTYYLRRVQHVTAKLARRAAAVDADAYLQLSARAATKLAAYAEFRRDWRGAVSQYQAAYHHTRAILRASSGQTSRNGDIGTSPSISTRSSLSGSSSFSGLSSLATSRQNSSSNVGLASGQGAVAAGTSGRPVGGLGAVASSSQSGISPVGMRGGPNQASTPMAAAAQGLPGRPHPVPTSAGASGSVFVQGGAGGRGVVTSAGSVYGGVGEGGVQSIRSGGRQGAGGAASVQGLTSSMAAQLTAAAATTRAPAVPSAAAAPPPPSVAPLSMPPSLSPPTFLSASSGVAGKVEAPPPFAAPPIAFASSQSQHTAAPRPSSGVPGQGWAGGAAPVQQPAAFSPGVPLQPPPLQQTLPPRSSLVAPNPSQLFSHTTTPTMPPPPPPPAPSPPPPAPPPPVPMPAAQQQHQHQQQHPHPLPYNSSVPPSSAVPGPQHPAVPPPVAHFQSVPSHPMPSQTMPAQSAPSQTMPAQIMPHPSRPAQSMPASRPTPWAAPVAASAPRSAGGAAAPALGGTAAPAASGAAAAALGGATAPAASVAVPVQAPTPARPTPIPHPTPLHQSLQQQQQQQQQPIRAAAPPSTPAMVAPPLSINAPMGSSLQQQQQQQQQQAHAGTLPRGAPSHPQAYPLVPQQRQQQPLPYTSQQQRQQHLQQPQAPAHPSTAGPMVTAPRSTPASAAAAAPGTAAVTPQPLPQPGPAPPSIRPGSAQPGSAQPRSAPGTAAITPQPLPQPGPAPGVPTAVLGRGALPTPSPQTYIQAARLAELLQLKLLMLLTVQERLEEAAAQAATHISLFAAPPCALGAAMEAMQLSFLARQLRVVAEVVSPKFEAQPSSTWNSAAKGCSRSLLLLSAAQAAAAHRRAVDALAPSSTAACFDVASVRPGQHLGQAVVLEHGSEPRPMTDAEFTVWLEVMLCDSSAKVPKGAPSKSPNLQAVTSAVLGGGPKVSSSASAVFEVLEAAAKAFKRRDMKAPRERALLCLLAGEELLAAGDLRHAHTHLLAAAHTYRREGWPELLLHTLLLLAESAQRLGLPTEAALHTLEASSLQPCLPSSAAPAPGSPPSLPPDAAPQGSSTSPAVGTVLGTGGTASGPALILNSAGGGGGGGGGGDAAAAAAAAAAASDASGTLQAATALLPVSLECCHAAAVALLSPACGPAAEQAEHAQQAGAGADSNVKGAGLLVGVNTCNAQKRHIFNVEYFDLEAREWLGGPELGVAREAPGAVSQLGGVQPSLLLQERGGGLAAAYAGSDGAGAGVLSPDVQLALEAHHQKDFGWWRILAVSVGWAAGTPPDTEAADCYVAVRSCLPKGAPAVPISGITLTLRDEDGEWHVPTTTALPLAPRVQKQHKGIEQQQQQEQLQEGEQRGGQDKACMGVWPAADALEPSGRWIHAKATVTPRRLGHLEVTCVSLHLGPLHTAHASPSPPSMHTPSSAQASPHGPHAPTATGADVEPVATHTPASTATEADARTVSSHTPASTATEAAVKPAITHTPALAAKEASTTVTFFLASFPRPPPGPSSCLSTHSTLGGLLERLAGVVAAPPPPPSPSKPVAGVRAQGSLLFPRPVPAPFRGLPAVDVRGGGGGGGAAITVTHLGQLPTLKLAPMPAVCTPSCCFLGEPSCVVATLEVAPNSQGLPEGVLECATKPLSPGLLPSDIFILALNKEGKVQVCNGTETARAHLPALKAGMSHTLRLWVVCKAPGKVALGAALQCPAVVARVCEWEVQQPLQLSTRLCTAPGVHTLPLPMARLTTQPSIVAQTADEGQPGSVGSMPNNSASSSSTAPPAVTAATAATSTGSTTVATAAGTALGLAGGVASGADGVSGGGEKGVGLASVGQQLLLQCSLQCFPGGQGVGADAGLTDGIPGGLLELLDVQVLPEPGFHLPSSLSLEHPFSNLLLPHLPPDTTFVPAAQTSSPSNLTPPSAPPSSTHNYLTTSTLLPPMLPSKGLELGPGDALTLCAPIEPHSPSPSHTLVPPPSHLPTAHQAQQQPTPFHHLHHHPTCPHAAAGARPQQQQLAPQHSAVPYVQPPLQPPQQVPLPTSPPYQAATASAPPSSLGGLHDAPPGPPATTTTTTSSMLATSLHSNPAGQGGPTPPVSMASSQLQPQPAGTTSPPTPTPAMPHGADLPPLQNTVRSAAAAAPHTATASNAHMANTLAAVPQGPGLTGVRGVCGGGRSAAPKGGSMEGVLCSWQPTKLGRLQVTWRRAAQHARTSAGESPPTSTPRQCGVEAGTTGLLQQGEGGALQVPPQQQQQQQQQQDAGQRGEEEPPHEVVSLYDLPAVAVCECSLSARALAPVHATAGIAFSLTLQVQSSSPKVEHITAQLLEAPGFVLSGERAEQHLTLPPYRQVSMTHQELGDGAAPYHDAGLDAQQQQQLPQSAVQGGPEKHYCTWLLVGHTPGRMALPAIQLHASGLAGTQNTTASLTARSPTVTVAPF